METSRILKFPGYGRPVIKTCRNLCRNPGYGDFPGYGNYPGVICPKYYY